MAKVKLHPGQSEVFKELMITKLIRFAVVKASRGWGKSYFASTVAATAISELIKLPRGIQNKRVAIIAPTHDQVTDIYFPILAYELGLEEMCKNSSRALGKFWFHNEVELHLVSYEAIERMRGKGYYLVVLDEPSSWVKGIGLKEAWQGIIEPCISTRWSPKRVKQYAKQYKLDHDVSPGRAVAIGTPKGYNHFYDMYNYQDLDNLWKSFSFDYTTSPFLDEDEINRIKHTIDPMEFNAEYRARFEDSGNRVFYNFDRKKHVRNDLEFFKEDETVHIGIDFNVGIQACSVFALRAGQIHYLDEIQGLPDTEDLARTICTRYKNGIRKVLTYPDPTGKARKTSAAVGRTDFSILESHGLPVIARPKSPPIIDSVKAVNRLLLTAAGDTNLYVSAKCQGLITSLERTSWLDNNPDTATIDKKEGIEHFSDGVRYPMEYLYPVQAGTKTVKRGFNF